jgi:hypothetical protein
MASRDRVLQLRARLTERDLLLLEWLADHQVLTTPQIATALFSSLGFTQRRLLALHRAGVIERFRPLRPGGGAYPWHYVLAQTGAETIAAARGQSPPRPSETAQRIRRIATSRTLDHLLGVNQFFTDLAAHARAHPPARLERWWSEARCAAPGAFGPGLVSPIRPDGHGVFTEISDPGDGRPRRVAFFLEHDTGTESHAVLLDKLSRYSAHATRGGPVWPVLFWLPSPAREQHLHALLDTAQIAVPVATAVNDGLDQPGTSSPAGPVWMIAGRPGQRIRLADLSEILSR